MYLYYLKNSVVVQSQVGSVGEILFKPLFGNSLLKQVLLYHHQTNKQKPEEPIILDIPESLLPRIKKAILNDCDLSCLDVRYGKSRAKDEGFPLNRIFYDANNFVDVHSPQDLARLRSLMKKKIRNRTPTFVARVINKPVSLPLSHLLALLKVRPNTITLTALLFSLFGAFFLMDSQKFWMGFVFFQVNSILDGCDGEVARLNLKTTPLGKKLDVYADYLTSFLLMEAGTLGILKIHAGSLTGFLAYPIALLPLMTGSLWLVVWIFKLTKGELDDMEGACHQKLASPANVYEKVMAVILWISRRDFYIFFLFILALAHQYSFIPIFMLLVGISWFILSCYSVKLARE